MQQSEGEPSTIEQASGEGGATTVPPPIPEIALREHRRRRWIELLAVMCLAVVPDVVLSLGYLLDDAGMPPTSPFVQFTTILARSIGVLVPFFVLMKFCGVRLLDFGLTRIRPAWDFAVGTLLWVVATYAPVVIAWPASYAALSLGFDTTSPEMSEFYQTPASVLGWSAIAGAAVINGFAEEVVVRGYLISRLGGLIGSRSVAVVVSSFFFGAYHLYYGVYSAFYIGLMGLVLGGFYAWRGRLWPVIIAHMWGDILPFLWTTPA